MSLTPAFEIGLWNAWVPMLVFQFITLVLFYLLNKEAFKKASEFPEKKNTLIKISIIFEWLSIIAIIYTIFMPLKLGTLWFYVGSIIYLLGLIIGSMALISFTTTPVNEVVNKGIYRISRHPFYVSYFLICIGIGLACASWIFLFYIVANIIIKLIVISAEEQLCLKKYGNAYSRYMNRTPRWIGIPKSV